MSSPETSLQVSYWDRVAPEKSFSHPLRVNWLRTYLDPTARIVDFGCGYGRTLAELSDAGYTNAVGVDFSEAMLRRSRVEVPHSVVVRNDGRSLPLIRDSIDCVILLAVLTCIPDDEDQREVIHEVARVLKPGGSLYISDLLINNDDRNRKRYGEYDGAAPYGVFKLPEGVVVRHHTRERIHELTSDFEELEYSPFTVTTMNGNSSAAFQYFGRKK